MRLSQIVGVCTVAMALVSLVAYGELVRDCRISKFGTVGRVPVG